jgi:hypothetical protein
MLDQLQSTVAGTRARFVISLVALCGLFGFSFASWLRFCAALQLGILPRLAGFAVLAVILVGFYALRFRQLRLNPAWALAALIPLGNIIVPIFLIAKKPASPGRTDI